jgi:hypothetical protein
MSYFSVIKGLFGGQPKEVKVDESGSVYTLNQLQNPLDEIIIGRTDGSAFMTTTPLTSGSVFDSGILDARNFTQVQTHVLADQNGTIGVEFCTDAAGTDIARTLTIPYASSSGFQLFAAPAFTPYIRYKFTNGSLDQGDFFYETKFLTKALNAQILGLDAFIAPNMTATLNRNVQVGLQPNGTYTNEKTDGYAFLTTTPLTSGSTYDSGILALSPGWSQVQTHVRADQNGTLKIFWYSDAAGTDNIRTLTLPYSGSDGFQMFGAPAFAPYIKYTFENGAVDQTDFYYDTKFTTKAINGQVLTLTAPIAGGMTANLGRNVIAGRDSAGNFRNVGVDGTGDLKIRLNDPLTAFGELKTANMSPLLQITHPYEINLDLVGTGSVAGGSVSYDSVGRYINIATSGSNSSATLYSLKPAKYRNGQGLTTRFTTRFGTPEAGRNQMAGWGDLSTGGFFFAYSGSNFGIMYQRSGSAATFISQSDWNADTMDGSSNINNPSGQFLSQSLGNVYDISAQWLGYGAVKFSIEDSATGRFQPVHILEYANTNTVPSVTNPTFPVSFTVQNTTATTETTMSNASMAAFVEGDIIYNGVNYSRDGTTASGTNKNMLTIYMPPTYKGYANKTQGLLKQMSLTTDGTQAVTFTLVKNGTFTGQSFLTTSTYSPVQYDITGTYTAGTGRQAFKIVLQKLDSAQINLADFEFFLREGDTWSIIANGNNAGAQVSLTWLDDV